MLFRKKYILIKIEGTYGTDPTPAAANAFETKNLEITPYDGATVSRNLDREILGNDLVINTGPLVRLTFDVELAGSGTAGTAPGFGPALRACGFAETVVAATSVTYDPVSASFESIAAYFDVDGQRHKVLGVRGSVALTMTRGQIPSLRFTLTGLYTRPTASALVTPVPANFSTGLPMTKANTPTFKIATTNLNAESFSADIANNVVYRNLVGVEEVIITDRAATGSMSVEAPAIGTKDFYADVESHSSITTAALQMVHGTTAGNILTLDAPVTQLNTISHQDSDGVMMLNMGALFVPGSTGDDELSLAFT